jgi:phage terminase large subunit-like protein
MLPTEYVPERKCVTFYARNEYSIVEQKLTDGTTKLETQVQVIDKVFEDPREFPGELLNEGRFGPLEVATSKGRLGPWKYASQQQQSPQPQGGGLFKEEWWQFYEELPSEKEAALDAAQAWDASFKDLKTSSYCVGLCGCRVKARIYVFHCVRDRMNFPVLLETIRGVSNLYPWIGPKLIEDKANGTAAISVLTTGDDAIPGILPRDPGQGGIDALANAISYLVQAGNVFLPGVRNSEGKLEPKYQWVRELIAEAAAFPRSEFNDQVAALSHLLYWFHERPTGGISTVELLNEGAEPVVDAQGWIF